MKKLVALMCVLSIVGVASAATVWNPAGNAVTPGSQDWADADNWTNGVPSLVEKAVFNVPGAAEALISGVVPVAQLVQGDGNVGGDLRVLAGGVYDTNPANWSAVGYNNTAHTTVDAGGVMNFGQHAGIGLNAGAVGTLDISGTVSVGSMLGLGWGGGDGYINIYDGGLLALSNIHGDGATSIKQNSLLDIIGTGQMTLPGNFIGVIETYAANGLIAGNGVIGAISADLDINGDTVVTAVPEPATMLLLGLGGLLIRKRR